MLGLHVHLLTGRYAATAYSDRSKAEWPPHPARIFSALVDALHAVDPDDVCADEAAVLDTLATWPPPEVHASDAHHRRVMTVFVPVNDQAVTDSASAGTKEGKYFEALTELRELPADTPAKLVTRANKAVAKALDAFEKQGRKDASPPKSIPKDNPGNNALPWDRTKQPRTFPVAIPHIPEITLVWPAQELSSQQHTALERLASRLVRLGHSSSMIAARVVDKAPDSVLDCTPWVPSPTGEVLLRVPQIGQRQALDAAFAQHGGNTPGRVLPARHVRYSRRTQEVPFARTRRSEGRWFVYHLEGQQLPPASAAVAVAEAVRGALLSHAPEPVSPWLTGHDEGNLLLHEHLAVLSLPFVRHPHADGHIRGVALSLPTNAPPSAERALLQALGTWEQASDPEGGRVRLWGKKLSVWGERVVEPHRALHTLRKSTWRGPSRHWVTVTPAALDGECPPFNHSKASIRNKARKIAVRLMQRAVARQLVESHGVLVEPEQIGISIDSGPLVNGAPHVRRVPAFQRSGHARARRLVHVQVELPIPVEGPLVIGSARHFGLGLCLPVAQES